MKSGAPAADPAFRLRAEPEAWDAFVAGAPNGAYAQLTAWAAVKAVNGWLARRVVVDAAEGPLGAQLLIHRLGPSPWSVGYAPRGPVALRFDAAGLGAWTEALRGVAAHERLSHIAIDPEVEAGDPLAGLLRASGWRPAPPIQPDRTRLIDLTRSEEALWADLRSKWRQYVAKARRAGVSVSEAGPEGLDDFYRIYVETARRAGFVHRAAGAYADVYHAFARRGGARLLLARLPDGTPAATLLLLSCGAKVIEPYGGMTQAGAATRANYLLKWEAIRSSREAGFATYDLWGLAHPGIEQFKVGFGGREVRWIGAWELVARPAIRRATRLVQQLRVRAALRRQGIRGEAARWGEAG